MSVIAEYTVRADDFVLGRATLPEMHVELERFVPDESRVVPYFWVTVGHVDRFETNLEKMRTILDLTRVDDLEGRCLYRGVCDPATDTLTGGILEHDVSVYGAAGNDEHWRFTLAFEDESVLSDFQAFVVDRADVSLQLEHIYNPVGYGHARTDLTDPQREALATAFEMGYFDVPRRITLVDLADELGVSDQAVSERLRRAESKLIRRHLFKDIDGEESDTPE